MNVSSRLIFGVLFILVSCSVTNKSYIGTYQHHVPNFVQSEITIKPDSTFKYVYSSGLEKNQVAGIWNIDRKGFLYLNSDEIPQTDSVKVEEEINEAQDSIVFFVTSLENEPLGGAAITFNSIPNFGVNLNEAGKAKVSKDLDINQFNVLYLGYGYSYNVINKKATSFRVKVYYPDPKDVYSRNFTNEKWKVKGDKLIDLKNKIKYEKKPSE